MAITRNPKIDAYLVRLDSAVARLPHADASDIVREIQAHIADKLTGQDDDAEVDRVLESLGSPEELASRYSMELLFTRASRTFSPWILLQTCARWAKTGAKGTAAFLLGLLGYGAGLALTITVVLKPFIPRIGLWVGGGTLQFGMPSSVIGRRELLGDLYIPVVTLLAFMIGVGTTQALRSMMRKRTLGTVL